MQVHSELAALVELGTLFRCSPSPSQASFPSFDSHVDVQASLEVTSTPSASNPAADVFLSTLPPVATAGNATIGSSRIINGTTTHDSTNGTSDNGPDTQAQLPLCYCAAESARKVLAFHAAALAPLIATYAAVLKYASAKLSGGEAMNRAQFSKAALKWLREAAAGSTSAISAVPSQLLVQHAVEALVEEGCLASFDDGARIPCTESRRKKCVEQQDSSS
jgi:hypothetical protein